ncbi:MAG TPA: sodium-coupled permease, partial [Candidatus Krumholzibacteria bacterium]|nr:sodium-coupled permease [Candidatus Krumholzibacteria bacterium]
LEAVVWTDALQLGVVAVGLGACLLTVALTLDGGLGAAFAAAAAEGRTAIVDFDQPITSPRSLPGAVVGYGILALAVAGTNQQSVQRYLACRSVAEARRAALLGWAVGAAVTVATLVVGLALYGFYRSTAHTLPADLPADAVLPHFVGTELAPGVAGLLVAAILAAAMSSLDSALSSLATATEVDLIGRDGTATRGLRRARWITLAWGVVATVAALALAGRGTLLELGVRVMGWFAGPILALFVMALLRRSPGAGAALAGAITGFTITVVLVADPFGAPILSPGIWTTAIGAVTTMLATILLQSTVGPRRRRPRAPAGPVPGTRREGRRDD